MPHYLRFHDTPSCSEADMSSLPAPQLGCKAMPSLSRVPLGPEDVEEWFDSDGRLVKEAAMRKALFEGIVGVAGEDREGGGGGGGMGWEGGGGGGGGGGEVQMEKEGQEREGREGSREEGNEGWSAWLGEEIVNGDEVENFHPL